MLPWAHLSPNPKRHLDRFNCFTGLASVTQRHIGRIYVRSTAMRPKNTRAGRSKSEITKKYILKSKFYLANKLNKNIQYRIKEKSTTFIMSAIRF